MTRIEHLKKAIREKCGCDATHVESVKIREERAGRILWEGEVEVFSLQGHQRARKCYAWVYVGDRGETRCAVILAEGHVDSARAAVRAAMVNESRRQQP